MDKVYPWKIYSETYIAGEIKNKNNKKKKIEPNKFAGEVE